jgi:hypothetical protein
MDNNLLNRDRLWNRLKRYLYYIIILLSLLIVLLVYLVVLNKCVFDKMSILLERIAV